MGCVPPLYRSSQPPVQFGDSSRGPLDSGEWTGIGRYLLPFPKMPPTTLHACGIYVKLPTLVTHAHGSAPAWEAQLAVLHLFYPRITPQLLPVVFALNICTHPSSISLQAVHPDGCCKGPLAGTETLQGLDHISTYAAH